MQISIANAILVARLVGKSIVRRGLKMWLDFKKSNIIGCELVDDGDFLLTGTQEENTTGTYWTTGLEWSIGGGVADSKVTANHSYLQQSGNYYNGKTYRVTFDIVVTSGNFKASFIGGGSNSGADISTSEVGYSIDITLSGDRTSFGVRNNDGNGVGSISNVSVREIAQFAPDKSNNCNEAELFTGKALEFNGNDLVDLGTTFGLTGEFTVAFWVNLTNYTQAVIVGDSANADWFRINSATQYTLKINNSSSIDIVSGGSIPLSSWSRIALIRDSNNLVTLSINGIIYTNNAPTKSGDFDFTLIGSKSGTFINGLLSNVQIYNKAWVSDDAAFDYANPNNLAIDNPNATITKSNLIGYWALSEGSGNIAFDSAGLGGELITNGDFATDIIGWGNSLISVVPRLSWSNGKAKIENTTGTAVNTGINSTNDPFRDLSGTVVVTGNIQIIGGTAGAWGVREHYGDVASFTLEANGDFKANLSLDGTSDDLAIYTYASNVIFEVDNISARQVTDNDGTIVIPTSGDLVGATYVDKQPTIPQLGMMDWSKGSNLIEFSEDFANAAWSKSLMTITSGFSSPNGSLSSDKLVGTTGAAIYNSGITSIASTSYTLSFYVKNIDYVNNAIAIRDDSNGAFIDVDISYTATSEWTRITHSFTTPVGCVSLRVYPQRKADGVGSMYVWGAQLEQSSTAGSYIGTAGSAAINATLIQNPNDKGKDVLGNSLRLREGGFNLDGSGYAEVADSTSLNITTAITLSAWVRFKEGQYASIISKTSSTNGFQWYVGTQTIKQKFYIGSASSTGSTNFIPLDTWAYVSVVYNGTSIQYYLDGQPDGSQSLVASIPTNALDLFIGQNNFGSERFKGVVDDVLIYDEALTATEILNNYNVGLPTHS